MKEKFQSIFEKAKKKCLELNVEIVGDRPCMSADMDTDLLQKITDRAINVQSKHFKTDVTEKSGSTDCNIPSSLGIPAVCVGTYIGSGAHTREEKVLKSSLVTGLKIVTHLLSSYFE